MINESSEDEQEDIKNISTPQKKKISTNTNKGNRNVNFDDQSFDDGVSSANEVSRTNEGSSDASTVNERIPQLSDIESDNGFNSDDTNIESIPDSNGLTSDECDSSSDDEDISYKCVAGATKEKCYAIKHFLSATDIVHLLVNVGNKHTADSIPDGPKENVYNILSEEGNRSTQGFGILSLTEK